MSGGNFLCLAQNFLFYSNVHFPFGILKKSCTYCLQYFASLGPTVVVKASQRAFGNKKWRWIGYL